MGFWWGKATGELENRARAGQPSVVYVDGELDVTVGNRMTWTEIKDLYYE